MTQQTHICRFCDGKRPHENGRCCGCGTDVRKCKPEKITRNRNECPGCTHTGPHKLMESRRYRCLKCTAVFEGPDFEFVDTRPEVNAAKKERAESLIRKRERKQ